jgi:prefoldin subunit 5
MLPAEASARQQPQHLQQQLSQLGAQLQAMQQRAAAKEASSKKYKDAVRAFKVGWGACC